MPNQNRDIPQVESSPTQSKVPVFLSGHPNGMAFVIFAVVGLILYGRALFTGLTWFGEDFLWQFIPMNQTALDLIKQGQWPLWNPYLMGGMPHFASLSYPLFYPGSLLFYVMPQETAVTWLYYLHLVLAGWGAWWCYREINWDESQSVTYTGFLSGLTAGLSFMLAGNLVTLIFPGHTMKYIAASFIPMVMASVLRSERTRKGRDVILSAILFSLQIMTLHFQVCYYTWLLTGVYLIGVGWKGIRKKDYQWLKLAGAAGLIIVGLTAVQWLPFYEYSRWCTRSGGMDYQKATEASYPPEELLSTFMVSPYGDHIHPAGGQDPIFQTKESFIGNLVYSAASKNYVGRFDSARTLSEYMGIVVCLLALLGMFQSWKESRYFYLGVLFVSGFLSLGKFNPLYPFILKIVPGLAMFRVPAEILLLFSLALSMLAGWGMKSLLQQAKLNWKNLLTGIGVLLVLMGVGYIPAMKYHLESHYGMMILRSSILVGFAVLWLIGTLRKSRVWAGTGILVLLVLDLMTAHRPYLQTMDMKSYYQYVRSEQGVYSLQADPGLFRILPTGSRDMINNKWSLHRLQSVWGYQSFPLKHYAQAWETLGFSNPVFRSLMQVKYITTDDWVEDSTLQLIEDGTRKIYQDSQYHDRVWFVSDKNKTSVTSPWASLSTRNINPLDKVVVGDSEYQGGEPIQIQSLDWKPQSINLSTEIPSSGWLVFSEVYYPGWKVTLNGQKSEIKMADGFLRAVHVTKGPLNLKMIFHPWVFFLGLWSSLLTLILSIIFWFRCK